MKGTDAREKLRKLGYPMEEEKDGIDGLLIIYGILVALAEEIEELQNRQQYFGDPRG